MKQIIFALTLAVVLSLTACSNPDNKIQVTAKPSESSQEETISYTEETQPTFSTEEVTFDGYALTSEGGSVPVRLTMAVENVLKGEAAWKQMTSQGTELSPPAQGTEYILVTVKVTYEDGELDTLNFVENYPASWEAARVYFNIPNENSNTEDVTRTLANSIWGDNPDFGRPLTKGESITGDVAFLQAVGNKQPEFFIKGHGQGIQFTQLKHHAVTMASAFILSRCSRRAVSFASVSSNRLHSSAWLAR